MAKAISFYFDIISPYSYLAFEQLLRVRPKWDFRLKLNPVLLAGVRKQSDNPLRPSPARLKYVQQDLRMEAAYLGIPVVQRDDIFDRVLSMHSLRTQRLLALMRQENEAKKQQYDNKLFEEVTRRLYHKLWQNYDDLTDESVLRDALLSAGVKNEAAEQLLKTSVEQDAKTALVEIGDELVRVGGFGTPTMVIHDADKEVGTGDSLLFGSDRIHLIGQLLGKDKNSHETI